MMRVIVVPALVVALLAGSAASPVALADPILTDQGPNWTQVTREDFYSRDQGSRMIPLAWLQNLKQANGQPFLDGSLARYGYLPHPAGRPGRLHHSGRERGCDRRHALLGLPYPAAHQRRPELSYRWWSRDCR